MTQEKREFASFRDPSGFLFFREGVLYRQVNQIYQRDYEHFLRSGLYDTLVSQKLLVPHQEVMDVEPLYPEISYRVIQPEPVDFITYPYEWCFLQLRGAALTTLRLARTALDHGMILKDASAYNLQFHQGRWQLIDTLSFEVYREGEPWVAYRQFCQHFLAPLAIMAYGDERLNRLSRLYIDGVPLDIVAKILPFRSRFRFGLLTHIHWHARSQKKYAARSVNLSEVNGRVSHKALVRLLESLRNTIKGLSVGLPKGEWTEYYQDTNYTERAFEAKKEILEQFIERVNPSSVWDLGANTGYFSRLASQKGILTIAFDGDPGAVSQNYIRVRREHALNLIPLVMDLTNPSPGLGWAHQERQALLERGPAEMVLALALVHHLAISNNLPLSMLANFFFSIGEYLAIEFIPKSDSQVQRLLKTRKDIFSEYTENDFESIFKSYFKILAKQQLPESKRSLYLMKARKAK